MSVRPTHCGLGGLGQFDERDDDDGYVTSLVLIDRIHFHAAVTTAP